MAEGVIAVGDRNALVRDAVEAAIAYGAETGLQVVAYHRRREVLDLCAAVADPVTGRRVRPDTLFNVFSVTKAVTATALHKQAERGLVDYDVPITTFWPEFAANGKAAATAVAICHNRMFNTLTPEDDPILPITQAIVRALELE